MSRVARISEAALRAGVQERAIRLAEQYGHAIARMVERIFDDLELEFEFDNGGIPHEIKKKIVLQALSVVDPDGDAKPLALAAGDEG